MENKIANSESCSEVPPPSGTNEVPPPPYATTEVPPPEGTTEVPPPEYPTVSVSISTSSCEETPEVPTGSPSTPVPPPPAAPTEVPPPEQPGYPTGEVPPRKFSQASGSNVEATANKITEYPTSGFESKTHVYPTGTGAPVPPPSYPTGIPIAGAATMGGSILAAAMAGVAALLFA